MSISNLLGQEPDRSNHERSQILNHPPPPRPGTVATSHMPITAIMSPPHQHARAGPPEYPKPRSHTPDRLDNMLPTSRQRSQSSGTSMMQHRPLYEPYDRYAKPPTPQFAHSQPFTNPPTTREEQDAVPRRDSLSQILQRPNSQPLAIPSTQPARIFDPIPPHRQGWYADPPPPLQEPPRPPPSGAYDTKPPGFREIPRTAPTTQATPSTLPPSTSPNIRRTSINGGSFNRGLAGLLNETPNPPSNPINSVSQTMIRQDSSQSQSDRSMHGDRVRLNTFSPFAAPNTSHNISGVADDQGRKGSDEISHKTIKGLGLENRRRFSPVPQAVHGAQARTPVPDGGARSEQGKVFSGLGGGAGHSTTPVPTVNGSMKTEDNLLRTSDNTVKAGRTVNNIGKRSRKVQDDESRVDGEQSEAKKNGSATKGNKRAKYQNSYKADLEEMATPLQRRGTPLTAATATRRGATPHSGSAPSNLNPRYDIAPIFKPKKMVKINTVASQVLRKPRRHLGSFKYEPDILVPEGSNQVEADSDICITPKLLPYFSGVDDLNCTYTMQVSKTWLQDRERRVICSSRGLWGTGIYTDDSDPVAAAIHMGWIKPAFNSSVDENLLQRIVQDQNPKIDIPKELKPPAQPLDVGKGKDLKITCVVMPQLESYAETARFGIRSRNWPEGPENIPHDGVSFSILKVEIVDIGPEERRIGRTGQSRRARLHAQLEQKVRATRLEAERIERVLKNRRKEEEQKQKQEESQKKRSVIAKTSSPLVNEIVMDTSESIGKPTISVDGDEWRRQLATAAA